jgi:hypothetical protein
MILPRARAALFLVLALPALLVAGEGWVLCVGPDGHVALEQVARICCPGDRADAEPASPDATLSSGAGKPCCCDCCIDLPLIASTTAVAPASDAHAGASLSAQVFAGAALSLSDGDRVLPSFPGHGRLQRSAPSQLFARTVSLRC